jgi:hypothetical protein
MTVGIGLIDTDQVAIATTATTVQILEIHASFARSYTVVRRSIPKRNKTLKKLDLSPGTLTDLTTNRPLLANVLIRVISNMWLVSRAILTTTMMT